MTEEVVGEDEDEAAAAAVGDGRDGDEAMGPGWATWGESANRRTGRLRSEGSLRGVKDDMFCWKEDQGRVTV